MWKRTNFALNTSIGFQVMEDEWSDGGNSTDDSDDSGDNDPIECTGKHDQEYFMRNPRRGKGLIFNFVEFDKEMYNTRNGSNKDADSLKRTLKFLGFEVKTYTNLTVAAVKKVIEMVSKEDHSEADCICICVMTHGHEGGKLSARDELFEVSDLWMPFTADRCPSLAGKPKLFFVQACRGNRHDAGSTVEDLPEDVIDCKTPACRGNKHDAGSNVEECTEDFTGYRIPVYSDILLAYSSVHGFSSIRDVKKGTWFMQSLCQELLENGRKHHLLTILTFVCKRVAIDFQTFTGEKQMPTVVSMLTRLLYFRPLEDECSNNSDEELQIT
ncbi:hypothetical protein J437_LFUL004594 [Ladona fulva]|uniref:Uncharacterized protein n=1 Tax=Ladona fulva TaxID=123851 RepID=A0A8K0NZB3_LADFU|nr:hypothetical protein J437_LFUL004594 [Ladona fulva]